MTMNANEEPATNTMMVIVQVFLIHFSVQIKNREQGIGYLAGCV